MTRWIAHRRPATSPAAARLLCFPHAGGSAVAYRAWAALVPADVDLCPVELPGRGTRFNEPPISDFASLLDALYHALAPMLDHKAILFGHSLGALIAFELARRMESMFVTPRALIVSGHVAPHVPVERGRLSQLNEEQLRREVGALGGTPDEALDTPELMSALAPMLRADFAACESYQYRRGPTLGCRVVALGGEADVDVPERDLEAWRAHTRAAFDCRRFRGGHFYLRDVEAEAVGWALDHIGLERS